jgi:hypothetical protein
VTLPPADDGALRLNRYAAIGSMLVPTVTNWFDESSSNVKPVGVDDLGDGYTRAGSRPSSALILAQLAPGAAPTHRRASLAFGGAVGAGDDGADEADCSTWRCWCR